MLHIFEFRVQKYADKGEFLLHFSVFRYDNKQISGIRKWISKKGCRKMTKSLILPSILAHFCCF